MNKRHDTLFLEKDEFSFEIQAKLMVDAFDIEGNLEISESIFEFFTAPVTNPSLFKEILSICSNNQTPNHDTLLKVGYFQTDDFIKFRGDTKNLGTPVPILYKVLDFLVRENVLVEHRPFQLGGSNLKTVYLANKETACQIFSSNTFANLFLGFEFIIRRYRNSILKVEVRGTKQGGTNESKPDISIGTGFLLNPSISSKPLVITNRHVVENKFSITLYNFENNTVEFEDVELSEKDDIALIVLKEKSLNEALFPNLKLNILDEIITLGFPSIPTTKDAYIVAHKGEVNSFVDNYWNHKRFIISARTSPGSSGSPIIDRSGRFLGIVTELLFEEESFRRRGIIPYYAGIPTSIIMEFVYSKFPPIIQFDWA